MCSLSFLVASIADHWFNTQYWRSMVKYPVMQVIGPIPSIADPWFNTQYRRSLIQNPVLQAIDSIPSIARESRVSDNTTPQHSKAQRAACLVRGSLDIYLVNLMWTVCELYVNHYNAIIYLVKHLSNVTQGVSVRSPLHCAELFIIKHLTANHISANSQYNNSTPRSKIHVSKELQTQAGKISRQIKR